LELPDPIWFSLSTTGTGPGQGLNSNWILWEGGDLDGSGTSLTIANGNNSNVSIPAYALNVFGQLDSMYVGYSAGNIGTFTQASSSSVVVITDQMILGTDDCVNGAQGDVLLSAGTLYVTNATHTANLDVRNGMFTLGPGATLVVDNLILNSPCGHFIKQPGSILIMNNPPQLNPNYDADGDGQSNGAEALAGTGEMFLEPCLECRHAAARGIAVMRIDIGIEQHFLVGDGCAVSEERSFHFWPISASINSG